MKKRTITSILLLLMTASMFACGNGETPNDVDTNDESSGGGSIQDSESSGTALGIQPEDNGGRDFNILVPLEKSYEFVSESNGEIVNDKVYNRSKKVEELFNINFTYQYESDDWEQRDTYNSLVINSVMAGDSDYDLVTGFVACTTPLILNDVLVELTSQSDLNLENPWWISDIVENLSIGDGKLYCAIGDANLSLYKDCTVMYFNKKVIEDFSLENPYDLVRSGKWTVDKLLEMSEAVAADLNNDGKITETDDRVGFYTQGVPYRTFLTATEIKVFDVDDSGTRVFIGLTDRLANIYDKLMAVKDNEGLIVNFGAVDFNQYVSAFTEDRALFHASYLYVTESELMRNMKSDFGLIPMPKYDETQEKYHTQIGTSSDLLVIPKTASDIDLTCRVMEALSYYSMIDVVPAYYEVALEAKYTRDEDVPEMLALIREGMTTDFAFCYGSTFSAGDMPNNILQMSNGNITSYLERMRSFWENGMENLNKAAE
ncbi:MAG: extracellular solute-binding protein [Clostridiales bacterium]|nr:extracellular solute-binding protein [Clostridiales bacterium]